MAKHHKKGRQRPPASSPSHPPSYNGSYSGQSYGPGGVPPLDAFDNLPKRRPPDLPGRSVGVQPPEPMPPPSTQKTKGKQTSQKSKKKAAVKGTSKPKQETRQEPKRKKRPVNPAKRRRNRRIAAVVAILMLIGAGVWYSINVLFKMENFAIENVTEIELPYTEEEILAAFPRQKGDNLFGFTAAMAQEEMQKRLPYVESVTIRRRLPNTVIFRIAPAVEAFYMPWEGQYAVISNQRKVLRLVPDPQPHLVLLEGLIGVEPVPGLPLEVSQQVLAVQTERYAAAVQAAQAQAEAPPPEVEAESTVDETAQVESAPESNPKEETQPEETVAEEPPVVEALPVPVVEIPPMEPEFLMEEANLRFESLKSLQLELNNSGLENINWVNVQNPLNITFRWEDRITVLLGPKGDLGKKIAAAKMMLTDIEQSGITAGDRGTLDLSLYLANQEMRFRPE